MKIEKWIVRLVRKKLGVKKRECFRFVNQKTDDIYYFTDTKLMKIMNDGLRLKSGVSLNWLLDPKCEIVKYHPVIKEDMTVRYVES